MADEACNALIIHRCILYLLRPPAINSQFHLNANVQYGRIVAKVLDITKVPDIEYVDDYCAPK
eukprot:scaffold134482_cov22-Prasinocladus_malaysianus.AAC.1